MQGKKCANSKKSVEFDYRRSHLQVKLERNPSHSPRTDDGQRPPISSPWYYRGSNDNWIDCAIRIFQENYSRRLYLKTAIKFLPVQGTLCMRDMGSPRYQLQKWPETKVRPVSIPCTIPAKSPAQILKRRSRKLKSWRLSPKIACTTRRANYAMQAPAVVALLFD